MKRRIRKSCSLRSPLAMSTSLLPKPKKIIKRGIYEMVSAMTGGNTKPRDYEKRINKGKY